MVVEGVEEERVVVMVVEVDGAGCDEGVEVVVVVMMRRDWEEA